ncbi:MAG: peptide chain release factor N(5)-glutamine methyltransferase [Candidatus Hydrogenedentes bacterium]|nr:peptide chain release factor N(5)-glutamine methyltransferase [Candidatus Hydrogenedentota bacterium]
MPGPDTHAGLRTLRDLLRDAKGRLRDITDTPRLDAELLLAHSLGLKRAALLARLNTQLSDASVFEAYIDRRCNAEPIAYITGTWEFFSLELEIEAPVLVPRPETEHLVETVLEHIGNSDARLLDLCTGSGCVAIAIAHNAPKCTVVATDLRASNLALARRNAVRHELERRIDFRQGDLFHALDDAEEAFNVIAANPPYIEAGAWDRLPRVIRDHEDPAALLAGVDGLDLIRRLIEGAREYLRPGGLLAFEFGMGQYEPVCELMKASGYAHTRCARDLAGIDRIAMGNAPE